jgi:hypothetical protein
MNELQFGGMEGDAGDTALGGFIGAVLAVTDYGVAERGELDSDLIL